MDASPSSPKSRGTRPPPFPRNTLRPRYAGLFFRAAPFRAARPPCTVSGHSCGTPPIAASLRAPLAAEAKPATLVSIHVALNHVSHYRYDRLVTLGPQLVRLRPAPHCRTRILSYSMRVEPAQHFVNWQQDPQANYLARLVFPEPTREFRVEVDLVAEMAVLNPFDFFLEPYAESMPFAVRGAPKPSELAPYLVRARGDAAVCQVPRAHSARQRCAPSISWSSSTSASRSDIRYLIRMEPGVQTPGADARARAGSCRDSGWLLVQLLRHLGLAARFVSGYLIQLTTDVKALDGPSGPRAATSPICTPGARCICRARAGSGWIRPPACWRAKATFRSPARPSRPPRRRSAARSMSPRWSSSTTCRCARVWEAPRVTKPYTEAQWARDRAARRARSTPSSSTGDVRLTMGGEPTFVSIDDPDGAEWNTGRTGPGQARSSPRSSIIGCAITTRRRAWCTSARASGIPGEQLPRWSLNCFWRRDGEPIWREPRADRR